MHKKEQKKAVCFAEEPLLKAQTATKVAYRYAFPQSLFSLYYTTNSVLFFSMFIFISIKEHYSHTHTEKETKNRKNITISYRIFSTHELFLIYLVDMMIKTTEQNNQAMFIIVAPFIIIFSIIYDFLFFVWLKICLCSF